MGKRHIPDPSVDPQHWGGLPACSPVLPPVLNQYPTGVSRAESPPGRGAAGSAACSIAGFTRQSLGVPLCSSRPSGNAVWGPRCPLVHCCGRLHVPRPCLLGVRGTLERHPQMGANPVSSGKRRKHGRGLVLQSCWRLSHVLYWNYWAAVGTEPKP